MGTVRRADGVLARCSGGTPSALMPVSRPSTCWATVPRQRGRSLDSSPFKGVFSAQSGEEGGIPGPGTEDAPVGSGGKSSMGSGAGGLVPGHLGGGHPGAPPPGVSGGWREGR